MKLLLVADKLKNYPRLYMRFWFYTECLTSGKIDMKLILASQSPTRKKLLTNAGIGFTAISANIDEHIIKAKNLKHGILPSQTAQDLADEKVLTVAAQNPDMWVLGADQICHMQGKIFNQPQDSDNLSDQMRLLCGQTHILTTAISIAINGQIIFQYKDDAMLTMYDMDEHEINDYVRRATPDVLYTAGGYHLESIGVQLFKEINGSYFSILGLPLLPLIGFLRSHSHDRGKR